jgi:predicted nucleic acid-binding protein
MRIILDTGPLAALMNRRDKWHVWASDAFEALTPPLWTCEAVLTEAAHLTGRPAEIASKVAAGILRIGLHVADDAERLERLLTQYAPRIDFADACVVRMAERYSACKVLTLDRRDFAVYRRNGRAVIPLIAPPS